MASTNDPTPTPGSPSPRGWKLLVASLLEQWKDRAFGLIDAESDPATRRGDPLLDTARNLERLRLHAFLQRTDPALIADGEWRDLRASIQRSIAALADHPVACKAVLEALDRLQDRLQRELAEHVRNERAWRDEAESWPVSAQRGVDQGPGPVETLALAEELEGLLLATAAMLEVADPDAAAQRAQHRHASTEAAGPPSAVDHAAEPAWLNPSRGLRVSAIAMQAARSGEAFRMLDRWLHANECTVDPGLRAMAHDAVLRWTSLDTRAPMSSSLSDAERTLLASVAWIGTARARIRVYRGELALRSDAEEEALGEELIEAEVPEAGTPSKAPATAGQPDEPRRPGRESTDPGAEPALDLARQRLREFARLAQSANDAAARWRLAIETAQRGAPMPSRAMSPIFALVGRLANELRPLRAAATARGATEATFALEWSAASGNAHARCTLGRSPTGEPGATEPTGSKPGELAIRFFDAKGAHWTGLDGQSASWLGVTTTIADGRAVFKTSALREAADPADTIRRGRALFVAGSLWTAEFEAPDDAAAE